VLAGRLYLRLGPTALHPDAFELSGGATTVRQLTDVGSVSGIGARGRKIVIAAAVRTPDSLYVVRPGVSHQQLGRRLTYGSSPSVGPGGRIAYRDYRRSRGSLRHSVAVVRAPDGSEQIVVKRGVVDAQWRSHELAVTVRHEPFWNVWLMRGRHRVGVIHGRLREPRLMVAANGTVALNVFGERIDVYSGTRRSRIIRAAKWAPVCLNPTGTRFLVVRIVRQNIGKTLGLMDLNGYVTSIGHLRPDMTIAGCVWLPT
jgi:hypothetical protein